MLTYFILGKIFYYCAKFEPIELAALEGQKSGLANVISLMGILASYQQRINTGEIALDKQIYVPYNLTDAHLRMAARIEHSHALLQANELGLYLASFDSMHPMVYQGDTDTEDLNPDKKENKEKLDKDIGKLFGNSSAAQKAF